MRSLAARLKPGPTQDLFVKPVQDGWARTRFHYFAEAHHFDFACKVTSTHSRRLTKRRTLNSGTRTKATPSFGPPFGELNETSPYVFKIRRGLHGIMCSR